MICVHFRSFAAPSSYCPLQQRPSPRPLSQNGRGENLGSEAANLVGPIYGKHGVGLSQRDRSDDRTMSCSGGRDSGGRGWTNGKPRCTRCERDILEDSPEPSTPVRALPRREIEPLSPKSYSPQSLRGFRVSWMTRILVSLAAIST